MWLADIVYCRSAYRILLGDGPGTDGNIAAAPRWPAAPSAAPSRLAPSRHLPIQRPSGRRTRAVADPIAGYWPELPSCPSRSAKCTSEGADAMRRTVPLAARSAAVQRMHGRRDAGPCELDWLVGPTRPDAAARAQPSAAQFQPALAADPHAGHGAEQMAMAQTAQPRPRAAASGATTWYFAEGFTGTGFDEYLTILNLGAAQHGRRSPTTSRGRRRRSTAQRSRWPPTAARR